MGEITDGFEKAKAWYESKTIIGIIITAIGSLIAAFFPDLGIDLGGAINDLISGGEEVANQADIAYGSIIAIWGIIQATWGRIKAKVGIKSITGS